jgi:hypothetical protein
MLWHQERHKVPNRLLPCHVYHFIRSPRANSAKHQPPHASTSLHAPSPPPSRSSPPNHIAESSKRRQNQQGQPAGQTIRAKTPGMARRHESPPSRRAIRHQPPSSDVRLRSGNCIWSLCDQVRARGRCREWICQPSRFVGGGCQCAE